MSGRKRAVRDKSRVMRYLGSSADVRAREAPAAKGLTVTIGLEAQPPVAEDPAAAPRKSRRGTETRRRSQQVPLRLLPAEKDDISQLAAKLDMPSIQALILDACQPLMSPQSMSALTADRDTVQALARQHGISEVQALLLHALKERRLVH